MSTIFFTSILVQMGPKGGISDFILPLNLQSKEIDNIVGKITSQCFRNIHHPPNHLADIF